MRRGEVRWYEFAPPDKRRPVLLMTREAAIRRLNEVTVIAITSTIRGLDSEVLLSATDGMRDDCVVNCDQVQTVARHRIGERITEIGAAKLAEVDRTLMSPSESGRSIEA